MSYVTNSRERLNEGKSLVRDNMRQLWAVQPWPSTQKPTSQRRASPLRFHLKSRLHNRGKNLQQWLFLPREKTGAKPAALTTASQFRETIAALMPALSAQDPSTIELILEDAFRCNFGCSSYVCNDFVVMCCEGGQHLRSDLSCDTK
jgi:hypothetical protein